ncbi:MAG: FAD-dependent oxidoreductase [Bdellovibrionaceae bacterium]|nr:FAD-dependent oxidoreductase [Pseudobdellovibrionaceae bacterium]MDW8190353.1 NAD(P)/FAD-dependent oxidoreductase [Pseudobdellovibrionaceae bacterium]
MVRGRSFLFRKLQSIVQRSFLEQQWQKHSSGRDGLIISRREFVKGVSLLGSGYSILSGVSSWACPPPFKLKNPIVVVGGGLAGLTTCYLLKKHNLPFMLFEASSRLGGRVFTQNHFNDDGQFVELGAELIDSHHSKIRSLAEELRLSLDYFPDGDSGLTTSSIYVFQNKVFNDNDLLRGVRSLVDEIVRVRSKIDPGNRTPILNAFYSNPFFSQYDAMSLRDFLRRLVSRVPNWVLHIVKVAYETEYGVDAGQLSAVALIDLIDTDLDDNHFSMYGESDEAWRIHGGNSALIDALRMNIEKNARGIGKIYCNFRLLDIIPSYLSKRWGDHQQYCLIFQNGDKKYSVLAEVVVLALPLTQLRKLPCFKRPDTLNFREPTWRAIQKLQYGQNTKAMLSFKRRFWRDRGSLNPPIPDFAGSIYSDWWTQTYWETSRLQAGDQGILTNFTGGTRAIELGNMEKQQLYPRYLQDLSFLHPRLSEFALYDHFSKMAWHRYPFVEGSYLSPGVGQYSTLLGYQALPNIDEQVYLAGEHADFKFWGFMEGAVSSAYRVVQQILKKLNVKDDLKISSVSGYPK